jgi:rhomboid protease GluP
MAFGFSPKFESELPLGDLTREQFLLLGIESAKKLGWDIGTVTTNGFVAYSKFSMSSWSEEIIVKVYEERISLKSECTGSQLFDWGKNSSNIENFIRILRDLKQQSSVEELNRKHEELSSTIIKDENIVSATLYSGKERFKNFFSLFLPTDGYFITPILIDLNIAVFIAMALSGVSILSPDGQALINWGANFRPVTLDGQAWRLFTSCFIHIGIIHLLMNMYALAYVGVLLEPRLGRIRFSFTYLFTGLIASTASLWWHDVTVSAGASGAIFGLYGIFLSMLTTDLIEKSARKALLTSVIIFVGYNLLNGLKEGIDNAAHLGGLLSGIIIGFTFIPGLRDPDELDRKIKPVFFVAIFIFGIILAAYKTTPNDIVKYDKRINEFIGMEEMALSFYQLPPSASSEDKLYELNERGIYYWKECIKLTMELDKLDLPELVHGRDELLIEYCQLRIKSYEFIAQSIRENTNQYQPKIDSLNKSIEGVVGLLKKKQ